MDNEYTSKPWHVIAYVIPVLLIGAGSYAWGWETFGIIMFCLGVLLGFWIIAAGVWQAHANYSDRITMNATRMVENAAVLNRVKDPNVWAALGYEMPAPNQPATIQAHTEQELVAHPDLLTASNPAPTHTEFPRPPVSEPKMKVFSNGVLRGAPLSEEYWTENGAFTGPEIRKLKKWMQDPERQYIKRNHPVYATLGFSLTKRGTQFLLHYADPEIRALFESKHMVTPPQGHMVGQRADLNKLQGGDINEQVPT